MAGEIIAMIGIFLRGNRDGFARGLPLSLLHKIKAQIMLFLTRLYLVLYAVIFIKSTDIYVSVENKQRDS